MKIELKQAGIILIALVSLAGMPAIGQEIEADATVDDDVSLDLSASSDTSSGVTIAGAVSVSGAITISESAMASVDNTQVMNDNVLNVTETLANFITVDENFLAGATGNIGLNVTAGDMNAQDNASAIAAVGAGTAGMASDGSALILQISGGNALTSGGDNISNQAVLNDSVLEAAQGNIGLNVVSGVFNVQKNALTVSSVAGNAVLASATASLVQRASFNQINHGDGAINQVSLGGNVLLNASGNIGVNVAAGTNNLQANSLNLSSAN